MELKNEVALVLGAVKGIGKGIGLALAAGGAGVALNYSDWPESLPDLKRDVAATGAPHLILRTNLLETEKIQDLVRKIVDHFGRLDILVNNIERGGWPVVHGPYDQQQWDLELETTLRAKQWIFEAALPQLKATGDGVVINLSSGAANSPLEGWSHYCSSKAGAAMLTQCADREAQGDIRVVGLSPGTVATEMQVQIRKSGINPVSQLDPTAHIPAEWVARALVWLATPEAAEFAGTDVSLRDEAIRARVGLTT